MEPTVTGPRLEEPGKTLGRDRRVSETHGKAAALAKANPKEWVKVGVFSASLATYIKEGQHQSYPGEAGTWDTTTRKITGSDERKQRYLYVMYMGADDE